MSWQRPVSPVERLWLVADAVLAVPFAAVTLIEGEGTLDERAWREAVAAAAAASPGAHAVLRGAACRLRWDAAGPPPVRVVDGAGWDARSDEGAPFLHAPLDVAAGPAAEVLLVPGPTPRVLLRAHHALMDGGAMLAFLTDVGRCLRGEAPQGHPEPVTDLVVARRLGTDRRAAPPTDALPPTGSADGPPAGARWRRLSLPGRPSQLLGRVAVALAAEARRHGDGPVRFEIPADLRRTVPVRSVANVSGSVILQVPPDATPSSVTDDLRAQVAAGRHADGVRALAPLEHVPLTVLRWLGRRALARGRDRFQTSGVLSNLGLIDPVPLSGAGFTARRVMFLPPPSEVTALFLTFAGHPDGVEVIAAAPRHLATGGRLEQVLDAVRDALVDAAVA